MDRYSAALGNGVCANFGNLNALNPTANCSSIDTNGSSIPIFYTSTKYDAVAWAAIWMYKVSRRRDALHLERHDSSLSHNGHNALVEDPP